MQRAKVLIVEDNEDMRNAVVAYLRDKGYGVSEAASAEAAMKHEPYDDFDIALLDIALPGASGLELTGELRSHGFDKPIIGITARDTIDDKIVGLTTGMSDYIVKPFDLRELEARINAQLRSSGTQHDLAAVSTKHFRIEPRQHKFFIGKEQVKLTLVEFRLMLKLMQHKYTTVSNQDLIEFAWGEDAMVSNPPIRIHISNLRQKIGDSELMIIHTIPGVGYMLQD
jgi:DNA-binding response OmpR family regulator